MSKSAVVFFSRTGHTKDIAQKVAKQTGADLLEYQAAQPYTDDDIDWHNDNSRANSEMNDSSARPAIANQLDLSNYDTIYLGYPIWWGKAARVTDTLLDTGALDGKTVYPFCTSGSSPIDQSTTELKQIRPAVNWQPGRRFGAGASQNEVNSWLS